MPALEGQKMDTISEQNYVIDYNYSNNVQIIISKNVTIIYLFIQCFHEYKTIN